MLEKLAKKGQLEGLKLEDFTLTTDPRGHFSNFTTKDQDAFANAQAFTNVTGEGKMIFINTQLPIGFYRLSLENSDFIAFGASALAHEQYHTRNPRQPHREAFGRQQAVFKLFKGEYGANLAIYNAGMQYIERGVNGEFDDRRY